MKLEKAKEDVKRKAIIEKPKALRVPLPVTKRELKNVASKVTKHGWNKFLDKTFFRPGIERGGE